MPQRRPMHRNRPDQTTALNTEATVLTQKAAEEQTPVKISLENSTQMTCLSLKEFEI